MEKCIPGNLVGHGKTLQEVRRPIALRRGKVRLKRAQVAQVSPMSRKCRANVAFIALVSCCMRSIVDLTYIAICAIVRLLRIESVQREVDTQEVHAGSGHAGSTRGKRMHGKYARERKWKMRRPRCKSAC
jgi:hypothetical protein